MVLRKHTVDLDSLHIEDIFGVPGKLELGLGENFKCPNRGSNSVTVDCDLVKVLPNQRRFRVRVRVGVGVGINGGVATVGFSVGGSIKMALGLRLQSGLVLGSGLVIRIGTKDRIRTGVRARQLGDVDEA